MLESTIAAPISDNFQAGQVRPNKFQIEATKFLDPSTVPPPQRLPMFPDPSILVLNFDSQR